MQVKIHRVVLGLLALMTLGGCASFNDCCYEKTQTVRAIKEYIKCGNPECSCYPHDYKCGWLDGFYEIATGGCDCPPAIAPARYYKPEQILKHGDKKRHAYYSGWQDGAARASQFPDTHYLRIYETCECPFPRCEKPCLGGQCGPCGVEFIGMSVSEEMIEGVPVGPIMDEQVLPMPATIEHPEDAHLRSSSNREIRAEAFLESDEIESQPKPAPVKKVEQPEAETLPLPTPDSGAFSPNSKSPAELDVPNARTQSETPLVSIPGYQTDPVSTHPIARQPESQTVGFVRLVEPTQSKQPVDDQDSDHIVIVDGPDQLFQMIESSPVIKLAE